MEERLRDYIQEVVDKAPPLSEWQKVRLAALLAPYAGHVGPKPER